MVWFIFGLRIPARPEALVLSALKKFRFSSWLSSRRLPQQEKSKQGQRQ